MRCNAKEYSQKLVEESEKINFKAPLNSWDIFIQGFQRNSQMLKDITFLKKYAQENKWNHDFNFGQKILHQAFSIIVTDLDLNIIFASHNMFEINGYLPAEVIGEKPAIFQGKETDPVIKDKISSAIRNREVFEETIINHRKNGTPYRCVIQGHPVFNRKQELVNFITFEKRS